MHAGDWPRWDALVQASPEATFYHLSDWLCAVRDCFGQDIAALILEGPDGSARAGVTFMQRHTALFSWATKPWATHYSGLILAGHLSAAERREAADLLLGELRRRFSHVLLVQNIPPDQLPSAPRSAWTQRTRETLVVDCRNPESLRARLSRRTFEYIRKARREGMVIEEGGDEDRQWELYEKTYARQGISIPFEKASGSGLLRRLRRSPHCTTYCCRAEDGSVSRFLLVGRWRRRAYIVLAGNDPEDRTPAGGKLLWWEAIERESCHVDAVDLVGTGTPGIQRFKAQFRPEVVPFSELCWWRSAFHRAWFHSLRTARRGLRSLEQRVSPARGPRTAPEE